VGDAEALQPRARPAIRFGSGDPREPEPGGGVGEDAGREEERLLRHQGNVPAEAPLGPGVGGLAADLDPSGVRPSQERRDVEQRRLAGPVRPEQGDGFAAADGQ
jgi:hypothetical protein